ncbi:MAG: STAS domain-containing protein [Thiobacillaceae bacterium]
MIECDDKQCHVSGDITVECAASLLNELKPHIAKNVSELDLSGVSNVDSTVLALILSCKREAQLRERTLRLSGLPASVITLADLYGISSLLQV